jgi:hypothetical protein
MNSLRVGTQQQKTSFIPGEEIIGAVSWSVERQPKSAEVRLFWYTEGKGTRDVGVVNQQAFFDPKQNDERPFRFTLPAAPYTFSGKLISLLWAIELVIEPGDLSERLAIVVSPTGQEILLSEIGKQVVA